MSAKWATPEETIRYTPLHILAMWGSTGTVSVLVGHYGGVG